MANRAIMGNVVLGLGVIGLGALVVAERNGAVRSEAGQARVALASGAEAPTRPAEVASRSVAAVDPAVPIQATATSLAGSARTASGDTRPGPDSATVAAKAPAPRAATVELAAATRTANADAAMAARARPQEADAALERASGESAIEHETGTEGQEHASNPPSRSPEPARDDELGCDAPVSVPSEASAAKPLKASYATNVPDSVKELLAAIPAAKVDRIEVKRGDTLLAIARSHKVSTGLIRRLNGIAGDGIRAGAVMAVPFGPFTAVADRAKFSLAIELDGAAVKKYAIGVGRDGSTPVGEFEIRSRVESPDWTSPEGDYFKSGDPANPLGSRWLGFGEGGYGIHGTTDPSSIGREASRGCVRLNAGDVEEVYDFLTIGSKVTIR